MENKELIAAEKAAKHAARIARAAKAHLKALRLAVRTAAMLEWEQSAPAREAQQEAFEDAFTRYRIEREAEPNVPLQEKVSQAVAARQGWETVESHTAVAPRPSRPPREASGATT